MFLIVGLGNPGVEYAATRHNIGFDMITYLCDEYDISLRSREHKGAVGKGIIEGEKVMLVHPLTFMNLSGECVRALMDFYKIDIENLIVISDDIDMPVGQIRVRKKGSAGGHNGLKNIISHLGTDAFTRIKIGVGAKPEGGNLIKHVLGRFSREENEKIRDVFELSHKAVLAIMEDGPDAAMNLVNGVKIV